MEPRSQQVQAECTALHGSYFLCWEWPRSTQYTVISSSRDACDTTHAYVSAASDQPSAYIKSCGQVPATPVQTTDLHVCCGWRWMSMILDPSILLLLLLS